MLYRLLLSAQYKKDQEILNVGFNQMFGSCTSNWARSLPRNNINKQQRLLNMAVRLKTNTPQFCQITPVLCQLHWLLVSVRIKFKVILITFKAIHGTFPYYIQNTLSIFCIAQYYQGNNKKLHVHMFCNM